MVWRRSCLAVSTPWVRGVGLDMAMAMEEVIGKGVAEEAVVREEVAGEGAAGEGAAWTGLAPLGVVLGRAVRTPSFLKLPWSTKESQAALCGSS